MNCPECQVALPTLNDICPECRKDLRRFKRANGLPVDHEGVPYVKLLTLLASPTSVIQTTVTLPSPDSVRGPSLLASDGETWPEGEPTPGQLEGLFGFYESREEQLVHLAFEEEDEDLQKILKEAELELSAAVQETLSDSPVSARSISEVEEFEIEEEVEDQLGIEEEFEIELSETSSLRPTGRTVYELDFDFEEAVPETRAPVAILPAGELSETDLLFHHADAFLRTHTVDELEFSIDQFYVRSQREDLELLFSLAHDSLFDPTLLERFQEKEISSDERTVEAESLKEEFQRIEKEMSVVPSFQMKKLKKGFSPQLTQREAGRRTERIVSGLLDLMIASALSIFGSGYCLYHHSPLFRSSLALLEVPLPLDLFYVVSTSVLMIPAWLVIYHLACLAILGQTLGMKAAALRLVDEKSQKRPSYEQLFVHACSLPCSLILVGVPSLFLNCRSLSDRLAEVRLIRE